MPERVIGRKRFVDENIQRRALDFFAVQRRQQIVLHDMRAARQVHHKRAVIQAIEQLAINDTDGLRRVRQQVDQHLGAGEKIIQLRLAVEAFNPIQLFRRAAPAAQRESPGLQAFRHAQPQHARAENADGKVFTTVVGQRLPERLLLLTPVVVETTEPAQQGMHGVLLHLQPHAGIFQAKQRHGGIDHIGMMLQLSQNIIDPCADGEDRFQTAATAQHLHRRAAHQRIVGMRLIVRLPGTQTRLRQTLFQPLSPLFRVKGRMPEDDVHNASLSLFFPKAQGKRRRWQVKNDRACVGRRKPGGGYADGATGWISLRSSGIRQSITRPTAAAPQPNRLKMWL